MKIIFEEAFDEVATFESYYRGYILKEGNFLMPYINVGVSEHPLNPSRDLLHIDYSYVVCLDVALIKYNDELVFDNTSLKFGEYRFVYLGGINLNVNAGTEFQILCKKPFLQIMDYSQLSKEFWAPNQRPNRNSNMNSQEVDSFFNYKFLPENLKSLFL
jgi:hypothetical protein